MKRSIERILTTHTGSLPLNTGGGQISAGTLAQT